jgi:putative Holliday junction resolvase
MRVHAWRSNAAHATRIAPMPARFCAIDEFATLLAFTPQARLIGVDLGGKTIGLALSDVNRTIASPLETLPRGKFKADAEKLLALAAKFDVAGLVIGLPMNMDGTEGPSAQSARAFVRNLTPLTDLLIAFWDERLSTAAVERTLIEADASRRRRDEVVDKVAAAYILQGALDRLGYGKRE